MTMLASLLRPLARFGPTLLQRLKPNANRSAPSTPFDNEKASPRTGKDGLSFYQRHRKRTWLAALGGSAVLFGVAVVVVRAEPYQ
jgi:hypothetical protein